jgi:pyruvate dehydrogenase E2 component (dihydrolipoamide acetyltransferase)
MAVTVFALPDLGEGLVEAELVEWHVTLGERVVAGQPLASVETDKAVVEIPAPWSGVVAELRAAPGELVAVGAPLVAFDDGGVADAGAIVGAASSAAPTLVEPPPAVRAVPAARRLAAERGVALGSVTATGPEGVIMRADVARAAPAGGDGTLSATRRSMARRMRRAHTVVVPATLMDVAEVSAWMTPRADALVRLARAICRAAAREPALNGTFDDDGPSRRIGAAVHLGLAVDTPHGLYVPVLREAQSLDLADLRRVADERIAAARARRLTPADQGGATFTLSSFGALGGRHATLVVTPPQIAILGAGRAYETASWRDGAPVARTELPLSLTFDHRAATGGEAARFLAAVVGDLAATT